MIKRAAVLQAKRQVVHSRQQRLCHVEMHGDANLEGCKSVGFG
jgi:hypothetical protein